MPGFVVETFVPADQPDRFARSIEAVRSASLGPSATAGVSYIRSYLMPTDEMGFHFFEADQAADVELLMAAAGIDVERIVAAVGEPADAPSTGPAAHAPGSTSSVRPPSSSNKGDVFDG